MTYILSDHVKFVFSLAFNIPNFYANLLDKFHAKIIQKYQLACQYTIAHIVVTPSVSIKVLDEFISDYKNIFILDELEKYSLNNMNSSVFQKGIHQGLDDLQKLAAIIKAVNPAR